ncbi:hypothetical protein [Sideroxydans lithotrophicus]|uniref:Uncharacterized protein n=1 Tax=Sideroxydans lithotrophicus (strain ES-1) TaxID=580332 RepID=D5CNC6_SIDLE|nr:hypothetical protein [Sideroxydans lithotrophicus]ADE12823.1 hypothetical protein Slit_2598 [Sideroxydans lithotrophicus ES-1]
MSGYGQLIGLKEAAYSASLTEDRRNQDGECLPADGVAAKKPLDSNELVN